MFWPSFSTDIFTTVAEEEDQVDEEEEDEVEDQDGQYFDYLCK